MLPLQQVYVRVQKRKGIYLLSQGYGSWFHSIRRHPATPSDINLRKGIYHLAVTVTLLPITAAAVALYLTAGGGVFMDVHKDLYKDVMMENHQPLTSLDGPSNRGTPERCPRHLYSQDCTEENHRIPQEDQGDSRPKIKVEDMKVEEETYESGDQQFKEEEIPTDISTDGASNIDTPERCPRHSQDCTEENHRIPQEDQCIDVTNIKHENIKTEEETYVRGDQECKEEEIPTDISTDGSSNRDTPERCPRPHYTQDCTEENHRTPQEDQGERSVPRDEEVQEESEAEELVTQEPLGESDVETDSIPTVRRKTRTGRNVKFTFQQNLALVTEVMKYHKSLFGRLAARTTARRKAAIWDRVVRAVNAEGHIRRSEESCKKRFSDIKRRVKVKMAKESRLARLTGAVSTYQADYLKYEEPLKTIIPPEVMARLHVCDTDAPRPPAQPPASHMRPRRQLEAEDEEEAGPSSPPRRRQRPSAAKSAAKPPRMSMLASSGETSDPCSPLLVGSGDNETKNMDPVSNVEPVEAEEEMVTPHLYPMSQSMPATPTVESPQPQISPGPPPAQPDSMFWQSLSAFQTQQLSLLTSQVRQLSNLNKSAHRRNHSLTALTAEVSRAASNLDQIRESNNRFQDTFLGMLESQTNAARDLNATILSLGTQLLARLPEANPSTWTDSTPGTATPVTTPPRPTLRTRGGSQQPRAGRGAPRRRL